MSTPVLKFMVWVTALAGAYLVLMALEMAGNVSPAASIIAGVGLFFVGTAGVVFGRRAVREELEGDKA